MSKKINCFVIKFNNNNNKIKNKENTFFNIQHFVDFLLSFFQNFIVKNFFSVSSQIVEVLIRYL